MNFSKQFLQECQTLITKIDPAIIEKMATLIATARKNNGRLFLIGSGGGAGHASHAVCDFRKLCNMESYSPYDNVSELTARVNDDGWESTIINWLKVSRLRKYDVIFVFSVGGGNKEKSVSTNIVSAIQHAKDVGAYVVGIVGKDGGYTKKVGDAVVVIPTINEQLVTPLVEGFQAVIWHLLVSHPQLQVNATKWQSVDGIKTQGEFYDPGKTQL